MQHIEQLAFVFMNAFDLHVKQGVCGQINVHMGFDPPGQAFLVGQLGLLECGNHLGIAHHGFEAFQL